MAQPESRSFNAVAAGTADKSPSAEQASSAQQAQHAAQQPQSPEQPQPSADVPIQQRFSIPPTSPSGQSANTGFKKTFYKRKLPCPPAIEFSSPEGRQLFQEALQDGSMVGFFKLMEQFNTQDEPAFCGLASLAMVLNALSIDPRRTWKGSWRWFHEAMLDCCRPLDQVKEEGITLYEASCLARCNGARVELRPHGSGASLEAFRAEVAAACRSGEEHIVVSYSRKAFLQTGDGHFSPIGGYHPGRDLVLVLDVARFKYPPHWVSLEMLYHAMSYLDPETGRPRGYMRLSSNPLLDSVLFSLDVRQEGWAQADEFVRQRAPALAREQAARSGVSAGDVVRRLVDEMPLASLDAFLVVRSAAPLAAVAHARAAAAAAAVTCQTPEAMAAAAQRASEVGNAAAREAAAAASSPPPHAWAAPAARPPRPSLEAVTAGVGVAAPAPGRAAALAAVASCAPKHPRSRSNSPGPAGACGDRAGGSRGCGSGCGSGSGGSNLRPSISASNLPTADGTSASAAVSSAAAAGAAAATAAAASGGGCGGSSGSSSVVMAAATAVLSAQDRCVPLAQRQQLLDELRATPLYGIVSAHLASRCSIEGGAPPPPCPPPTAAAAAAGDNGSNGLNGANGNPLPYEYLAEKATMALLVQPPGGWPGPGEWAEAGAGEAWSALLGVGAHSVVWAEVAYLREQLAHIDEVLQSGDMNGTCGEHSSRLDCAAHGH